MHSANGELHLFSKLLWNYIEYQTYLETPFSLNLCISKFCWKFVSVEINFFKLIAINTLSDVAVKLNLNILYLPKIIIIDMLINYKNMLIILSHFFKMSLKCMKKLLHKVFK